MREFEKFLKVSGWESTPRPVQKLVDHLARKIYKERVSFARAQPQNAGSLTERVERKLSHS